MSGYGRDDNYDDQQGGDYGSGRRGYNAQQGGGRQQGGGGYDDQQGGSYGEGRQQGGGGYDDQQGGSYGGGRQQQGGYDDQQGGGRQQGGYNNQQGGYDSQQGGGYEGGRQQHHGGGNIPQGGNYGGGGGYGGDEDISGAAHHAQQHAGDSGDSSIFSSVAGYLGQNKQNIANQNVNEQDAVNAHKQFFGGGGGGSQQADSGSMGSAAAMQALKMFSGGGSGNSQSGNSQNAFIGMAMGQASKLFDQQSSQGNVSGGASKESAVQQAGQMALNMYLKSQGGGGASGLMGLASKFF